MTLPEDIFPERVAEALPQFTLAGYRDLETGVLVSVGAVEARFSDETERTEHYEPIFTGGPDLVAPLLAVLIGLAEDHADGQRRIFRFAEHRWAAQKALSEFVRRGGRVP